MSLLAKFTIPIEPKSLQFSGKRMMVRNGQVRFFKTSEATRYQGAIAAFAHPYTPETPTEEPLIVDFLFILQGPSDSTPRATTLAAFLPTNAPTWTTS